MPTPPIFLMVTVTDSAKEELKRILSTTSLDTGKFLRLTTPPAWVGEGDFGIVIDEEHQGDHLVDFQSRTVLVIDEALAERLSSSVFDFKSSPQGPAFTLDVY